MIVGVDERLPQAVADRALGDRAAGQRVAMRAAVDGAVAAIALDAQRVQVVVHGLDDARQRRVRLGQLGAHLPALRDVGHDAADLERAVRQPAGARAVVHPARDAVRAGEAVLDVGVLAGGQRAVELVVGGAVGRVERGLPVLHLGIGHRAAEQPVRARALEELLDAAVRERLGEIDVLAHDVEQAAEAVARLRQSRVGLLAPRDVGDDAPDQDAAVGLAQRPRAVLDDARDAVDADDAVLDLGVLAAQQGLVEARVRVPVLGVDARLPELAPLDAGRRCAAQVQRPDRVRRAGDEVAVRCDLAGVDALLEQVENACHLSVGEAQARSEPGPRAPGQQTQA